MLQLSSIYVPLFREEGRGRKNWQYDVLKYPVLPKDAPSPTKDLFIVISYRTSEYFSL